MITTIEIPVDIWTTTCLNITTMEMTISHVINSTVTTTDIIIRPTATRDREDNHHIETTSFRMIATNLREGRTEMVIEITTTTLRTPEIAMMGGQIRTPINHSRTTSVERRTINLLEIVREMMTINVMTSRKLTARSHKMTLRRRKTQLNRVFPMRFPV